MTALILGSLFQFGFSSSLVFAALVVVEKMSAVEPDMEDLFQEKKRVRNPLVPLGLFPLSFDLISRIRF